MGGDGVLGEDSRRLWPFDWNKFFRPRSVLADPAGSALTRSAAPFILAVILLAVVSLVYLASTARGIGILPDSVAYMRIGAARHFAPLYTWLLQATTQTGIEITTAAWLLNGLLYVANTWLILKLLVMARLGTVAAALGTSLIVLHPVFVEFHAVAMTEPLFFAFALSSVVLFLRLLQQKSETRAAVVGGVIGLGMLTRFAAAPLLPTFAAVRLVAGGGDIKKRAIDCALMIGVCALVFAAWLITSEATTGQSTGRSFELRGEPDAAFWLRTIGSAATMLLPGAVDPSLRIAFLAVVVAAVTLVLTARARSWLRLTSDERAEPEAALPIVFGLLSIFYAALLIATVFIQYKLNLTGRFLLPLYVFVALAALTAFGAAGKNDLFPTRALAFALAGLAFAIGASNLARTAAFTIAANKSGLGYSHSMWSTSPVLAAAARLPVGATIYSNAPDLIEFRLKRSARYLPARINHLSGRDDGPETFAEQTDAMRRKLESENAYVVLVDGVDWRYYLISGKDILVSMPVVEEETLSDGRIYRGLINKSNARGSPEGPPG
jgi:hypothetical protein